MRCEPATFGNNNNNNNNNNDNTHLSPHLLEYRVLHSGVYLCGASSAPLGDVTPVHFLHLIAESVLPPHLIHLGAVNGACFYTVGVFECNIAHRRSVAI